MTIGVVKNSYKVLRSILFTAVIVVVVMFVGLYTVMSMPPVQNYIRKIAETELSNFLGGEVRIGNVDIFPFNEVRLKNIEFITPEGEKCIKVETLGGGVNLWRLFADRKIEFTYAEVLGLDGNVVQKEKDGPLNISYIIEALSPKDKNKPPTKFDLRINNIVIRRSSLSFDRLWKPENKDGTFDPNHIKLSDLKADVTLPQLKNDDFIIDIRRLAFVADRNMTVDKLAFKTHITPTRICLEDFVLQAGGAEIKINDQDWRFTSFDTINESLYSESHDLNLTVSNFYPKEFGFFYAPLKGINDGFDLALQANGKLDNIEISNLRVVQKGEGQILRMIGSVENLTEPKEMIVDLEELSIEVSSALIGSIMGVVPRVHDEKIGRIIKQLGHVKLGAAGKYYTFGGNLTAAVDIRTSLGEATVDIDGMIKKGKVKGNFGLSSEKLNIGELLGDKHLGDISFDTSGSVEVLGKDLAGSLLANVNYIDFKGSRFSDIHVKLEKSGPNMMAELNVNDPMLNVGLHGEALLAGAASHYLLNGDIINFSPASLGFHGAIEGYSLSTGIMADIRGSNFDNVIGHLHLDEITLTAKEKKPIVIRGVEVDIEREECQEDHLSEYGTSVFPRIINFNTDFLTATVNGRFRIKSLVSGVRDLLSEEVTTLINPIPNSVTEDDYLNLIATIRSDKELPEFIKLPVKPLKDIEVRGGVDLRSGKMELSLEAPYLLQGANKLISGTRLTAAIERGRGSSLNAFSMVPIKNDRASLELSYNGDADRGMLDIGWQMVRNSAATGKVSLDVAIRKSISTGRPEVDLTVLPSSFRLGPSEWTIGESNIFYTDRRVGIENLLISHDKQFVAIDGIASSDPEDKLEVRLADIDLDNIFGILNINYVSFGGIATGEIEAYSVFTKTPVAQTRRLDVKNLSYNEAVLGDASIYSCWNNDEKEVEIHADIIEDGVGGARIDGGIFVTRDSLAFDMKADMVNIGFLKPFMSAFTSDVGGRASGNVKLFGSFKDIDLVGKAFADSIYMKVDYTNVYYHGSDSVLLNPGRIEIPSFRLYDRVGHSAILSGFVKHSYFHDPEFEFRLTNAGNLLCYDTNSRINPDWYGTIYASGNGALRGRPGIVSMEMDMTTEAKSDFTFVLSETQTALDYTFLSFSDKKKESELKEVAIEETFEDKFLKRQKEEEGNPTIFSMDLRATVTPQAKMTLVMDPAAGDKITAHGAGPLQIHYDTESDEMTMYGKYTLVQGNYNFSLQELILRDFKIREGSNIAFNGDPLAANIDITAAYRVNTNLSDLDKSFSTDRDLNRTNVPVDALLKVRGDLQNPEISFDISLPTLTSDVERKVRSIISTEDMMNRQIIYLLALNKFYTPEYMGSSSNGGELASVASSTISSQLSNIMGQLTDKFTVAPSFRSDKGDFSDMEVDVSLSSRLLNNRLLINGNFGYRDRSTSQTTFVGDFDIEYLLSRNGNLRLKAYNHFNDQNYYLKSSLTTQGLGIVYRKEFDNPFTWLRRRKKEEGDSIRRSKDIIPIKEEGTEFYEDEKREE